MRYTRSVMFVFVYNTRQHFAFTQFRPFTTKLAIPCTMIALCQHIRFSASGLVLGQFPPMAGEPDRCSLPPDRRPCTNKGTVRFYFDTDTLRCSSFLFRGCPTRGNNFRSHVECLHTCLMRRGEQSYKDFRITKALDGCLHSLAVVTLLTYERG